MSILSFRFYTPKLNLRVTHHRSFNSLRPFNLYDWQHFINDFAKYTQRVKRGKICPYKWYTTPNLNGCFFVYNLCIWGYVVTTLDTGLLFTVRYSRITYLITIIVPSPKKYRPHSSNIFLLKPGENEWTEEKRKGDTPVHCSSGNNLRSWD